MTTIELKDSLTALGATDAVNAVNALVNDLANANQRADDEHNARSTDSATITDLGNQRDQLLAQVATLTADLNAALATIAEIRADLPPQ